MNSIHRTTLARALMVGAALVALVTGGAVLARIP